MAAQLLEGDALAEKFRQEVAKDVENLKRKGRPPSLVAVQVGDPPASRMYVRKQRQSCEEMGMSYTLKQIEESAPQEDILGAIQGLNRDDSVTGIILQMPLPEGIDAKALQRAIVPQKDVEGMHPGNMGLLVYGEPRVAPCTAMAALELFRSIGRPMKGLDVTVVGHSEIVGKPLCLLLLGSVLESATPTVCHIATQDLRSKTLAADVLFVAAGKPGLITGDMVKEGSIVIDIGINRVPVVDEQGQPLLNDAGKPKKKTVGDVIFEEARQRAAYISPVPGGVGPLTVVMLLRNTVACAQWQEERL